MIKAIWKSVPADAERAWFDLAVAEIVALALAAAFLLWLLARVIRSKRGGASHLNDPSRGGGLHTTRNCRWRRDRRRHGQATMFRWVCSECGVDGYTSDGKPPKVCKRHQKEPVL
jgi:hypothetical protein